MGRTTLSRIIHTLPVASGWVLRVEGDGPVPWGCTVWRLRLSGLTLRSTWCVFSLWSSI